MKKDYGRCPMCGGTRAPGTTSYATVVDGHVFLFEGVPALLCGQCGEAALTVAVTEEIERIIRERPPATRLDTVRVYDLAGGRHQAPAGSRAGTP